MADISQEFRQKSLGICKQFIGGSWLHATQDEFKIDYVSGGLSNMLYLCEVSEDIKTQDSEPRKVLLRIYGQIIQENPETVVTDSVIYALLAEKNMGPGLYGCFTGGRVEEYVKSRHLHTAELHNPFISVACAKVMANFHKLHMPLIKEPRWLFDTITRYLDEALNNVSFDDPDPNRRRMLQKLMSYGLASEFETLKSILKQVPSPVVFCHNDLQEGNILLPDGVPKDRKAPGWYLQPIDFEYANYNWRGFDIGNHFREWVFNYHQVDEYPFFRAVLEDYPNREQQLHFIRSYLDEVDTVIAEPGTVERAQVEEHVILEANAYALASDFLWGVWGIVQSQVSKIEFGYLEYSLSRFETYYFHKTKLPSSIQMN